MLNAAKEVICNSFTICNAEMQEVGVGLYPSCDPNCSVVFNGPHLLLRAVRNIEVGEELTICYLDMLMTSEERRKQLRDQYCFECDCLRCQTQDKARMIEMMGNCPGVPPQTVIWNGSKLAFH
ncbi:SET and MYND domain-containing protein 3 [Saguinus oedipus]|uniref:SET and MYND domain-containing protein 3 n=1 Tax=Saguinus oedipus TaxID=9490 RepID=A0ABQ9TMA7_SAGOE|nr:SET and MYND domain-containing protein 3 [Saguinus oedipus]